MLDDEFTEPEAFGLVGVPIPVPPMLEEALGYPGEERYVLFHEWRPDQLGFYIDDAQGTWQGAVPGWSLFLRHPAVACICERLRLDLSRSAPAIPRQRYLAMAKEDQVSFWRQSRSLVLDRNTRRLYAARRDNALIFVTAATIFPPLDDDEDEDHGDPQSFEINAGSGPLSEPAADSRPPLSVARRTLREMRLWLDDHDSSLELNNFRHTPSAFESSGLARIPLHVGEGIIEAAFGYGGDARYISLHWSPVAQKVFVCGGIGHTHYSAAVEEWRRFLNHPLVIPRLQPFGSGRQDSTAVDFSATVGPLPDSPLFASSDEARRMEADVETNCLLLDRATDGFYVGPWSGAILFHSFMGMVVLEEDLAEKPSPENVPSLADWLEDQNNNVDRLLAAAVAHSNNGRMPETLGLLDRCLVLRPDSYRTWFHIANVHACMNNWPRAIEACEEAIKLHPTADRQDVRIEMLLKWRATFLVQAKRYIEAVDAWRLLLEIDRHADRAAIYSGIARCHTMLAAHDDAVLAREQVVKWRRESLRRAVSFRNYDGDDLCSNEEAEEEVNHVEDLREDVGNAWRELGRAYALAGRMDQSEWAYRQAVDTFPSSVRSRAELGVLLKLLGRDIDAQTELAAALDEARGKADRDGMSWRACRDLAFAYKATGNDGAAEEWLRRAAAGGWTPGPDEFTFPKAVSSARADST